MCISNFHSSMQPHKVPRNGKRQSDSMSIDCLQVFHNHNVLRGIVMYVWNIKPREQLSRKICNKTLYISSVVWCRRWLNTNLLDTTSSV